MRDLHAQLRSYAEHLDALAPTFDELDLERSVVPVRPAPSWRTWRMVAAGAATAAAVVIAVAVAALAFRTEAPPVADTTPTTTLASPDVAAPSGMALVGDEAVVAFAEAGTRDGEAMRFAGPGGLVRDEGTYHMFANRYGEESSVVVYATSSDLIEWAPRSAPVLASDAVAAEFGIRVRSAARLPDGAWALYFDWETKVRDDAFVPNIGIATAPAPEGPWTVAGQSVIDDGRPWRAVGSKQPSVVVVDGTLVMYFVGVDADGVGRIGRATSRDGLGWDVDRTPVLEASQEWERGTLSLPNVVHDGERWIMLYAGRTPSGQGFVVSGDGISWSAASETPALTVSDVQRPQIRDTELVVTPEGELRLLLENGGARTTSDIWLLAEVIP